MTELKKLDIRAKESWFMARIITFIIFAVIMVIGWVFLKDLVGTEIIIVYFSIDALILIFLLINALVYPAIEYKQWTYSIDENKVQIVHGIFFITSSIVPIVRIQHVEMQQGPINRIFNLANIEIKTAGGSISIPGIHKDEAASLAEYINVKTIIKVKERLNIDIRESGVDNE